MTTALEHNAELVKQLKEMVILHEQGLFMDIELLGKAAEYGNALQMPAETDIDENTGLSHRKPKS